MAVLAALADFGPHAQREPVVRLGVDASDMTKVIDQLAAAGWVERRVLHALLLRVYQEL
ncbi:MarR family transcriptional regulator [Streptomyces sp. NPDC051909]|uniref:MarR family transcriptional regulator n=1 Tax=Streptomyces sp. NPDC051909 TaxID=3154944 RepID=UPI0034391779